MSSVEFTITAAAPARESRFRRFFGGLVLSYGYQGLLVIVGIWLTPFYLRSIGQHDFGLWLLGTQLLLYLTLTDFGVVALLPLETAYATGRSGGVENADDLPVIVGQTARIVLYQWPLVAALALAMWFSIPAQWQELRGPLAIVLAGFVIAFPLRILPALLQGLQDLAFANGMQIVNWALSTGVTVVMVMRGWSLYALAVGWLLGQTLLAPICFARLKTRFPGALPHGLPRMAGASLRTQLGKGFWINVHQVASLLMANTDLLIIGKLFGPAAVVPYSCTGKLPGVLANQVGILMHAAQPGLCELKTGGSKEKLLQVLLALTHGILTFSGLVFCLVLLINKWFVTWWVTAGQYGGIALTVAILINMLFVHWDTIAAYSVFSLGHQRRISLTNLGNGIVTAAGTLGFGLLFGVVGAPLGSLAGTCLIGLPFNLVAIARDTGVSVPRLAAAMLGRWSIRFAVVAAPLAIVCFYWSPKNLLQAAAAAACVSIVYLVVMLPCILRSPLSRYLQPWIDSALARYAVLRKAVSA